MYHDQLDGKERWQQFLDEAEEYRRAHHVTVGTKKPSSSLRNLLTNMMSIFAN